MKLTNLVKIDIFSAIILESYLKIVYVICRIPSAPGAIPFTKRTSLLTRKRVGACSSALTMLFQPPRADQYRP